MTKDKRQTAEYLDIAHERIAAEKAARTGRLDLSNLGLTRPPPGLSELDWLEELILGGGREASSYVYRRSDAGGWKATDEAYNPSRIEPILSVLTKLPRLRSLDCSGAELQDLSPLADLSALESLNCRFTQVTDLKPLAGCSGLRKLDCWETRITNLPESVIELPSLKELIIQARPEFGHIPAEVLSQSSGDNCLSRLRAHLADLDTGAELLRDLKVIVLGNGRIGKTQLCRRLRGEEFEADADSTHGISVTSVELAMPGDSEIRGPESVGFRRPGYLPRYPRPVHAHPGGLPAGLDAGQ